MASTEQLTRTSAATVPAARDRETARRTDRPAQKHVFWASYFGWLLDGFDTTIYAFVLVPALKEILPASGTRPAPPPIGD